MRRIRQYKWQVFQMNIYGGNTSMSAEYYLEKLNGENWEIVSIVKGDEKHELIVVARQESEQFPIQAKG